MQHRVKMILYRIYKSIKCFKNVLTLIRKTNSSYISKLTNLCILKIITGSLDHNICPCYLRHFRNRSMSVSLCFTNSS